MYAHTQLKLVYDPVTYEPDTKHNPSTCLTSVALRYNLMWALVFMFCGSYGIPLLYQKDKAKHVKEWMNVFIIVINNIIYQNNVATLFGYYVSYWNKL